MKIIKLEKDNCTPCQIMDVILAKITDIPVEKINVEKEPAKAAKFGVMTVPVTILLNENGEEVARFRGATTLEEIVSAIDENI
jgi:thioredoxin 1